MLDEQAAGKRVIVIAYFQETPGGALVKVDGPARATHALTTAGKLVRLGPAADPRQVRRL